MQALVTGATGFIGRKLVEHLDNPVVLSRDAQRARAALAPHAVQCYSWDPLAGPPPDEALLGVDTIFHLAGEPVAEGRWTEEKRQRIRDSRVLGTRHLVDALERSSQRPRVLVSYSAVGFYGSRGDDLLDETSPPPANAADDFLVDVCQQWEAEARRAESLGVRVVLPRVGVVLGHGGALTQMLPPFRWGIGSPLGSGDQWMPWIHVDDLIRATLFAAETESLSGPVNAVAPQPVTNREFTYALGRVLNRWTFLPPVPSFMLYLVVGEFAQVLLSSQRVAPRALERAGFEFQYTDVEEALREILTPVEQREGVAV